MGPRQPFVKEPQSFGVYGLSLRSRVRESVLNALSLAYAAGQYCHIDFAPKASRRDLFLLEFDLSHFRP